MAEPLSEQVETRNLETLSGELQRRLDDAWSGLQRLMVQQAAYSSLLNQIQSDLNAALALGREVKGLVEERQGVAATLQAAVEKTRETVAGQVEHVRERAVAAFHRIKGENPRKDGGRPEDRR